MYLHGGKSKQSILAWGCAPNKSHVSKESGSEIYLRFSNISYISCPFLPPGAKGTWGTERWQRNFLLPLLNSGTFLSLLITSEAEGKGKGNIWTQDLPSSSPERCRSTAALPPVPSAMGWINQRLFPRDLFAHELSWPGNDQNTGELLWHISSHSFVQCQVCVWGFGFNLRM